GRHVDDHRPALARQPEAHRQGQRQFLANVAARLINQGEAVGVGIEGEADIVAALSDQRSDLAQVLGGRLGRVLEEAVRVAALADWPDLERLQQSPAERPAGAAVGIEEGTEPGSADARYVYQLEHAVVMPVLRASALLQRS